MCVLFCREPSRPLRMLRVLAVAVLALLAGAPGALSQSNDILTDPLAGTRYRTDGEGGTHVDIRTSIEP